MKHYIITYDVVETNSGQISYARSESLQLDEPHQIHEWLDSVQSGYRDDGYSMVVRGLFPV